ncbi:GCN5 family acetyltransferase [Alkalihalobacillus trypoxylicola]|uniref:GCN5 family acetyltransferase n=1 Tax=Alkalihalobacillus trypoxylicola TaxID=519424 RepID=A0A162DEF7_9BACI|nr:GNAT family protein [Alkalihalobacillus trypoxylicola]KYG29374.1 GCN5 family acetyltransferase [Alkalihalobacillus trypoxylicola]
MRVQDIYGDLPEIKTERLRLRKWKKEDLESLYAYGSNENVTKYVTWDTYSSYDDAERFIEQILQQYEQQQISPWAIEWRKTGDVIGNVDFVNWNIQDRRAELGYVLNESYWNKGVMTEAVKALIQFGFEKMNLVRLEAKCFEENIGSAKVMEKSGMLYEGKMRKYKYIKGIHQNIKIYSILKEDYDEHK